MGSTVVRDFDQFQQRNEEFIHGNQICVTNRLLIEQIEKVISSSTEHLAEVFTTELNALTAQIMALTIALTGRPPVIAAKKCTRRGALARM